MAQHPKGPWFKPRCQLFPQSFFQFRVVGVSELILNKVAKRHRLRKGTEGLVNKIVKMKGATKQGWGMCSAFKAFNLTYLHVLHAGMVYICNGWDVSAEQDH